MNVDLMLGDLLTAAHGDDLDLGGNKFKPISVQREKLMDFSPCTRDVQSKTFSFQNYLFRVQRGTGKHISGSLVERKKNCCNEFKRWKKKPARFDKLV